ncbi:hypothetical protein PFISCL1PPCAC_15935, partial [Pristionchus fissidentatus]
RVRISIDSSNSSVVSEDGSGSGSLKGGLRNGRSLVLHRGGSLVRGLGRRGVLRGGTVGLSGSGSLGILLGVGLVNGYGDGNHLRRGKLTTRSTAETLK